MLKIANKVFSSRLFTGTGKFATTELMHESIKASQSELVTVALKRVDPQLGDSGSRNLYQTLKTLGVNLLPNTSGARSAEEAIFAAQLARDLFATNWIKLEIHPDSRYLMPDPIETLQAAESLVKQGFIVLPYCHCDPVICKRLEEVGCAAVMPLSAPIGSNQGIIAEEFLRIIVEQANVPVVIDAGIGHPSDASKALELGADAVLVNTAIATANNPVEMADAFRLAVLAGRKAWNIGTNQATNFAQASSPMTDFFKSIAQASVGEPHKFEGDNL